VQEFIYPLIGTIVTALVTWFFARRKTNAEAKSAEIDNEIKASDFYKSLLDDLKDRLESAIKAIEERDNKIIERDKKIDMLLVEIEQLTDELRKFKQLNGKT
jgi:uncharacterized membrane protein YgaE (UPF0421/DUF939 family)